MNNKHDIDQLSNKYALIIEQTQNQDQDAENDNPLLHGKKDTLVYADLNAFNGIFALTPQGENILNRIIDSLNFDEINVQNEYSTESRIQFDGKSYDNLMNAIKTHPLYNKLKVEIAKTERILKRYIPYLRPPFNSLEAIDADNEPFAVCLNQEYVPYDEDDEDEDGDGDDYVDASYPELLDWYIDLSDSEILQELDPS